MNLRATFLINPSVNHSVNQRIHQSKNSKPKLQLLTFVQTHWRRGGGRTAAARRPRALALDPSRTPPRKTLMVIKVPSGYHTRAKA